METNLVQQLTDTFEDHAQQTENGVEYWLARDLQQLLGYAEWRNFHQTAISKAETACEVSGHRTADQFVDVNKLVKIGSGTQREIDDIMLTRYACYLIAQNGDPRKMEIAFAQTYFAIQRLRVRPKKMTKSPHWCLSQGFALGWYGIGPLALFLHHTLPPQRGIAIPAQGIALGHRPPHFQALKGRHIFLSAYEQ